MTVRSLYTVTTKAVDLVLSFICNKNIVGKKKKDILAAGHHQLSAGSKLSNISLFFAPFMSRKGKNSV